MNHLIAIAAVLSVAAFTQSLTGFGVALVSMPLLSLLMGLPQATALVAVVSLFVETWLLRRYWQHLRWQPVLRLIVASLLGIPLGVLLLARLPQRVMLGGLGALIVAYSLYALSGWRMPRLQHPAWAWGIGLLAGALGGAYNTSGPPVILYGHASGWPPNEFKANLQAFFLSTSIAVFAAHWLAGDISRQTWETAAAALLPLGGGLWLGKRLDTVLSPERFRQLVLIALVLMGIKMLV